MPDGARRVFLHLYVRGAEESDDEREAALLHDLGLVPVDGG